MVGICYVINISQITLLQKIDISPFISEIVVLLLQTTIFLGRKKFLKLKMAQYKGPAKESQRVMHLQKKREREQEELEIRKKKLADELAVTKMDAKFSAHYDAVENDLKSSTVGLLTISEMKTKQELAVKEREMILARKKQRTAKTC